MKKRKPWIGVGIGILAILFLLVSLSMPYPEKEGREVISRIYENYLSARENQKNSFTQILLSAGEAVVSANNSHNFTLEDIELESLRSEPSILIGKGTEAYWEFYVDTPGEYRLSAGYFLLDGNGGDLELKLKVDEKEYASPVTLTRLWSDSGNFTMTGGMDEVRPEQQIISIWAQEAMKWQGSGDVILFLEQGVHTIRVEGVREEALFQYLQLEQQNSGTYEQYLAFASQQGYQNKIDKNFFLKLQAETPYLRSSPELYPIYDRSSAFTTPYHATAIRYNTIGGSNWSKDGQWMEWELEIEEEGFYQIGMRYRQSGNKGMTSARRITLDGELLFQELEQVKFPYDTGWQTGFLGGEEPYSFYLKKGKHRLRMEVDSGVIAQKAARMEETLYALNSMYREIIIITGTEPDHYRDYHLETVIPGLTERLKSFSLELEEYETFLHELYTSGQYAARVISQLKRQLISFAEQPYTIQKRLSMLKTNISAMAEWILEWKEQPLELDCLYLTGIGGTLPKAETNLFGKAGHEMRAFFGSFFHSYNDISDKAGEKGEVTIRVWLGKGRDQANVIKRLIDDYFTPETGIHVNLSLVEGALVKASIAGQGPDVNLFTTRGEAMNLAFRGALEPLSDKNGFSALAEEYMEQAFVPYTYDDKVYGIPEEQIFYMMFIRTDIFAELGIEIPETWQEVKEIMPVLQSANLEIGLPYSDGYATMNNGIGTINLLPTLLVQNGISIYNEEHTQIQLTGSKAYQSFKLWTDFYTMYDFSLYKDDFNRFRTGEMPVIIAPYPLYNNLAKAAPELAGQWVMTTIPGTKTENGINISTGASGNCSIILKNCKTKDAAWKFLCWWNSAEIQAKYAKEIEAELSVLGRYTPANRKAFQNTAWYEEEKEALLAQWRSVVEIPEIPGGYYTSRNIDNAFRAVYYNGENARESLYYWMNGVNEELERKQKQILKRKQEAESAHN